MSESPDFNEEILEDEDWFEAATEPFARSGEKVLVKTSRAPARLFPRAPWHPTRASIMVNGKRYDWSSRAHRKMRYVWSKQDTHHPSNDCSRVKFFSWEPRIVSWYIAFLGEIANTLWVVNGLYATWPEQAHSEDSALMLSYVTGFIGAFLFIACGYLGYVEAINHSYADVSLPDNSTSLHQRGFRRPHLHYGHWHSPIGAGLHVHNSKQRQMRILEGGFPLVQDVKTKYLLTPQLLERFTSTDGVARTNEAVVGRQFDVRLNGHVIRVTADSVIDLNQDPREAYELSMVDSRTSVYQLKSPDRDKQGYRWWTWEPDFSYIGIFNALVFFIATIVFFIPAVVWKPMSQNSVTLANTVFWIYILQIVPSVAFVYVGFGAMAEVSGSWIKPKFDEIGWWIGLCNMLGGVGFLLYPVLGLPGVLGSPDCCDSLNKWGAGFATFWGSCLFWIAGLLQWIEFSSEHPISVRQRH